MPASDSSAPLVIEVTRGPVVESRHRVHAVVLDANGQVVRQWGDPDYPTFPRSASKPLQALPLILSGAADHWALSPVELALACASHGSEERHITAVSQWLERIDCTEAHLECGQHWPTHEASAYALARRGKTPCALHNNCSGKHSGFLSVARQLKVDPRGYVKQEHPVQQHIQQALEQTMGLDLNQVPVGIDGCSIPTWCVPLQALARGMARFGTGVGLPEDWATAARRLQAAMLAEPYYVAGTGRHCTRVMEAFGEQVVCKGGAEGVYAATVPELGVGLALKVEDGTARAAEVALSTVLDTLGVLPEDPTFSVAQELRNRNDLLVGEVRPAAS